MNMESPNHEFDYKGCVVNGFLILFLCIVLMAGAIGLIATSAASYGNDWMTGCGIFMIVAAIVLICGIFVQQPNQANVMIFFGKYKGTFRPAGFYWVNPFMSRKKVSLRILNLDVAPIKVNDKTGNPVMIGMVLVWRVRDTYRVVFDIDTNSGKAAALDSSEISEFVKVQSDAALREVTSRYAYDDEGGTGNEVTLRSGSHEIVQELEDKLNERLSIAGIEVVEARINYLAYAPEIAAVMLRRQQASAIIMAREKIVEGAVSMVKMALNQLSEEGIVVLDEERKAAMVSNLLVVLCADEPAQPVVNTGGHS